MYDIPDEAVEAAAQAIIDWGPFQRGALAWVREGARAALTAAYPHLLAENARLRAQVEEYEAALRTIDRNYGHEFAWHVAHGALSDEGKP